MPTCKICLRNFQNPRFNTPRICVCGRCVNLLNEYKEVAEPSYAEVGEMLRRGMHKNVRADSSPDAPIWKQKQAQRTLENFESEYQAALPGWTKRLLRNENNRRKIFKIIRAERRGLLHFDRPHGWGYPSNWKDVAQRIRSLDHYRCVICGAQDSELHVHHIVYVSNFGTHRQENLATLCKACHEAEHGKNLDFGETLLTDNLKPTANKPSVKTESINEYDVPSDGQKDSSPKRISVPINQKNNILPAAPNKEVKPITKVEADHLVILHQDETRPYDNQITKRDASKVNGSPNTQYASAEQPVAKTIFAFIGFAFIVIFFFNLLKNAGQDSGCNRMNNKYTSPPLSQSPRSYPAQSSSLSFQHAATDYEIIQSEKIPMKNRNANIMQKKAEGHYAIKQTEKEKRFIGSEITISLENVEIKDALNLIAQTIGENIIVEKDVSGIISVNVQQPEPWDKIFRKIINDNDLVAKFQGDSIQVFHKNSSRNQ